jgi:FkbM family methyltransferase
MESGSLPLFGKWIMDKIRRWIGSVAPSGLVDRRRRNFRLKRLGLPNSETMAEDANTVRFELWPPWLKKPSTPRTLVDVGANFGDFTDAMGRICMLETVHAFEPLAECQLTLERILHRLPSGHLHQHLVGSAPGKVSFHQTSNSKMASILKPLPSIVQQYPAGDMDVTTLVEADVVCLDDALPPDMKIDLLKVDVQGYELPVLHGAVSTLSRTAALLIEVNYVAHYERASTFDEIYGLVRDLGFRTFGISAPYLGTDGPLWADAMFVKD